MPTLHIKLFRNDLTSGNTPDYSIQKETWHSLTLSAPNVKTGRLILTHYSIKSVCSAPDTNTHVSTGLTVDFPWLNTGVYSLDSTSSDISGSRSSHGTLFMPLNFLRVENQAGAVDFIAFDEVSPGLEYRVDERDIQNNFLVKVSTADGTTFGNNKLRSYEIDFYFSYL